jgi:hypothetical protein
MNIEIEINENMDINTLNEKLTLEIVNIDKLKVKKDKLEGIYDMLRDMIKEKDLSKVIEYTLVCLNIALALNNASLNKSEMARSQIEQAVESKIPTQSFLDCHFNYSNNSDKGVVMKQRYEVARKKLVKYQDQIAQCYHIKKSMDNEFNR